MFDYIARVLTGIHAGKYLAGGPGVTTLLLLEPPLPGDVAPIWGIAPHGPGNFPYGYHVEPD